MSVFTMFDRKNESLQYIGQRVKAGDMKFYDKQVIFPLKSEVIFEGQYFYVPNDYDVALTKMYGDYMTLPKPENRHWHAKKIEV